MNKYWHELTCAEANAARNLGYDDAAWDQGLSPAACQQPWATLSSQHIQAGKDTRKTLGILSFIN